LAEDFGREDAKDIFSWFALYNEGFLVELVDEESKGMNALSATK
jgi:hypothetical protein